MIIVVVSFNRMFNLSVKQGDHDDAQEITTFWNYKFHRKSLYKQIFLKGDVERTLKLYFVYVTVEMAILSGNSKNIDIWILDKEKN